MYKDNRYAAQLRRDDLILQQARAPFPPELLNLHARRVARSWAGGAGIVGAALLLATEVIDARFAAHTLLASWLLMGATYLALRVGGRPLMELSIGRRLRLSGDVYQDLAMLETGGAAAWGLGRLRRLERPSLALPLVAASLLAPLSLHLLVAVLLLGWTSAEFGRWATISAVLVGHAHVCLLIFSLVHVSRVQASLTRDPAGLGSGSRFGMWALTWVATAAAVPGAVLFFVPPFLVFLTGLAFVPAAFHWASSRAATERQLIVNLAPRVTPE